MIHVAVAEDEQNTYEQIHNYLDRYAQENHLDLQVSYFPNGLMISDSYIPCYDIILMDVDMPLLNGMDAARKIRMLDPAVIIIFITNLSQYAIQGYSVQAFDYILKPLQYFPFSEFFGRAVTKLQSGLSTPYFTIRMKDCVRKVAVQNIYYIEIQNHTLYYHTYDGVFQTTGKLKEVEARLQLLHFCRCSNSYLVNLAHVESIQENDVLVHGELLSISRSRKKEFTDTLMKYISSHLH